MGEKTPNHSKGQEGACTGMNDRYKSKTFENMSGAERAAILEKSRIARQAKNEARKASTLRRDFLDADLWQTLARTRGLRLPPQGEAPTVSNFRSWLRKIGLTQGQYEEELGCTLAEYIANNALWPLRAIAGVSLEYQANEERRTSPMSIRDNEDQTQRTA